MSRQSDQAAVELHSRCAGLVTRLTLAPKTNLAMCNGKAAVSLRAVDQDGECSTFGHGATAGSKEISSKTAQGSSVHSTRHRHRQTPQLRRSHAAKKGQQTTGHLEAIERLSE